MRGQPEVRRGRGGMSLKQRSRVSRMCGRALMRGGSAFVLALCAWVLVAGVLSVGSLFSALPTANAAGMGLGPTMTANGQFALLYPTPQSKTAATGLPVGQFAAQYVAQTAITFGEDVTLMPNAPANLTLRWNFGDSKTYTTGNTPAHTFAKAGTYTIRSQLYNSQTKTWTGFDSAAITIIATAPAKPPIAIAHVSSSVAQPGAPVTFDATASRVQGGGGLTYLWNFNDGQTSTQSQVQHAFKQPGTGLVSLTVTDDKGESSVTTLTIAISQVTLGSNVTAIKPGGSITFTANATATPATTATATTTAKTTPTTKTTTTPAAQPPTYVWTFGDGTPAQSTTEPTTSHTFAKAGKYPAALREVSGKSVLSVQAVLVTVDPKVGVKPVTGVIQFHGVQIKVWEIYAIIGLVVVSMLIAGWSAVRTERRRAAAILADKDERRKAKARVAAQQSARAARYDDYDDYDDYEDDGYERGSGSRHAPRRGGRLEYDERESSRGGSGRRAHSRDYDGYDGYGDYDGRSSSSGRARSGRSRGGQR